MREEERQAQRAAARAERRTRRAAEQAAQNVPQKTEAPKAPQKAGVPHKKKKINKFRVAVVCTAAVLVALVALGVASAAGVRTPISSIAADGEPEFFSTVKPQASAAPAENTASAAPTPSSAFDGALFIGDSMTTCLKNYVTDGAGSTTALSDAEFMTRSDYSWDEAQDELNGGEGGLWLDDDTALTVTEAIDRFSATKLYIQLGKEDLTYNDVSDVTSTAQAVISALQTKYPNLEITVQAVTPMLEWIDYQGLSSGTIAQYNEAMQTYCTGKKNLIRTATAPITPIQRTPPATPTRMIPAIIRTTQGITPMIRATIRMTPVITQKNNLQNMVCKVFGIPYFAFFKTY